MGDATKKNRKTQKADITETKEAKYFQKKGKRAFTENEKDIFDLGVLVGEARCKEHCRDLAKSISIQMRANRRLFEVIQGADKRD